MKKFASHQIGLCSGDVLLFSDFENDGDMWAGQGPRLVRRKITFSEAYATAPNVTLQLSMVDMSNDAFIRADLQAENITPTDFEIVFRTWEDSRIARVRVAWQSIGAVSSDDNWDL